MTEPQRRSVLFDPERDRQLRAAGIREGVSRRVGKD